MLRVTRLNGEGVGSMLGANPRLIAGLSLGGVSSSSGMTGAGPGTGVWLLRLPFLPDDTPAGDLPGDMSWRCTGLAVPAFLWRCCS